MSTIKSTWLCFCILVSLSAILAAEVGYHQVCGGTNTCSSEFTCLKPYRGCNLGVCVCEDGYAYSDSKCKKDLGNGEGDCTATADNICTTNLGCLGTKKCGCSAGTYNKNFISLCLEKSIVGTACQSNDNCQSGLCDTGTTDKCICPSGKKDYDGNGFCRKPYYGETCTPGNNVCVPDSVECAAGKTRCSCTGSTIVRGNVVLGCKADGSAKEGQSCSSDNDCEGNQLTCNTCGIDGNKECRFLATGKASNVDKSLTALMIGIALFILSC